MVRREKHRLEAIMEGVAADVLALAQSPVLTDLPAHPDPGRLDLAVRSMLGLARNKPGYAQVRFLHAQGWEQVRVQRDLDGVFALPVEELQDKSGRYYVREGLKLEQGLFFVSRLDLNVENGRVEDPPRPVLRFAAPVRDGRGGVRGLVVINYDGHRVLAELGGCGLPMVTWNWWITRAGGSWDEARRSCGAS